jgi:hypothetical protein
MTDLQSHLGALWRALPVKHGTSRSSIFICELPLDASIDPFVLYRAPKGRPVGLRAVPAWRFGLIERRLQRSGRLHDFRKRIAGVCGNEDDARREAERLALACLSAHQRAALAHALTPYGRHRR